MLQVAHIDIGHSTRHGELLLRAHTRHDDFVNSVLGVFFQCDVDDLAITLHKHFLRFVADVGEDERLVLAHLDFIVTFNVGDDTQAFHVLHDDAHADELLARGVGHLTGNLHFALCQRTCGDGQQR